jgi:hypothetical protein
MKRTDICAAAMRFLRCRGGRTMTVQRFIVMLALIIALVAPAAAQDITIAYALTFFGNSTRGTIGGELGRMIVEGFYDHGRWLLLSSDGQRVVEGTYRCDNGCTFDGVLILERASTFRLNVPALEETVENVSGSISINQSPSMGTK